MGFKPDLSRPSGFLQCFDTVGLVIWPVKIVPEMTLNPTHSLTHSHSMSLSSLSWTGSVSSSSVMLVQFCSLHAGVHDNPFWMQMQLSSAQTRGHLQAIRERTISGTGAPVNYDIAMSPSFRYQP